MASVTKAGHFDETVGVTVMQKEKRVDRSSASVCQETVLQTYKVTVESKAAANPGSTRQLDLRLWIYSANILKSYKSQNVNQSEFYNDSFFYYCFASLLYHVATELT